MASEHLRLPTVVLFGFWPLSLASLAFGQGEAPAPRPNPETLSTDDWADLRAAYEAGRHALHAVDGGHEARNPGQAWRTHFDGRGSLTEPDAGGWTWGLQLERYGFAGSERELTLPASVRAEGGRMAYRWDATLEEWYENDTRGLEHGCTLGARPQGGESDSTGPLTFALAVRGKLRPEVAADGRGVRFLDAEGAVALTYDGLSVIDAEGRELPASFERVREGLLLSIDERGARYPIVIDPVAQQAYLKASNTDAGDQFGRAVAVSGDTVVVGAFAEASSTTGVDGNESDNSANLAGAAYVFVRNGTSWSQQAYLKASNTGVGDQFGFAVGISGDTLVVGAWGEASAATGVDGNQGDNSIPAAGAAYVFVRNGTSWSQEAYLKPSNTGATDRFGWSVAVSGDTVLVGAYGEDSAATGVNGNGSDNSAPDAGAAYVFVRNGSSWIQEAYLKASNTDAGDLFGFAVGLSGDKAVVGALWESSAATGVNGPEDDNGTQMGGAAYVFERVGTTWSQDAYLKASNTGANDWFGRAVAISGDTVVVGAHREDSAATTVNGNQNDESALDAGAAYVFVHAGTSWSQEAYLKPSNTDADDQFGWSVAISGDRLVVGADWEDSAATGVDGDGGDNSASKSGAAYLFTRTGTGWSQTSYLKASNTAAHDGFGVALAASTDLVVVGAAGEDSLATGVGGNEADDSASNAGASYVYDLGLGTSYCTTSPNSTGNPAVISVSGTASVAANDLVLRAEPVPDQPGVFFYGPQQASLPFGNGTLCISGQIGRLDVVNASGNVMTHALDNTNPPSTGTQITSGSTWHFQAWFRDPASGGAFFNLSNALTVVFAP